MDKDLQDAMLTLKKKYGSHRVVADVLGFGEDHYCAMRNGRTPITKKNERYILSEAKRAAADMPPPAKAPEASEARA